MSLDSTFGRFCYRRIPNLFGGFLSIIKELGINWHILTADISCQIHSRGNELMFTRVNQVFNTIAPCSILELIEGNTRTTPILLVSLASSNPSFWQLTLAVFPQCCSIEHQTVIISDALMNTRMGIFALRAIYLWLEAVFFCGRWCFWQNHINKLGLS